MSWEIRVTLTITLMTLPFAIYLAFRVSAALRTLKYFTKWLRISIALVPVIWYLLLPIYYGAMAISGSSQPLFIRENTLTTPDYLLLFPFWLSVIVILEAIPYFVSIDLINLVLRLTKKRDHVIWDKTQAAIKIVAIIFLLFYAGFRSYNDTYHVQSTHENIAIQNLPAGLQNLKVGFFADVQIDRYTQAKKLDQFKNILQSEKPDMLFFAGDLVTSGKKYTSQATELMSSLSAGKRIAVLGDHDYWSDPSRIPAELKKGGWIFLQNEHRLVEYAGDTLLVTGVTHIYSKKTNKARLRALLEAAPDVRMKILLVHQPAEFIAALAAEYGYQILLAGHTHGGGIVAHPWGIPVTPSRFETRYFSGFFTLEQLKIVVTNGIGNTLSPLRYHATAEVIILRL
ncbi:MAG: hypothetical protein DWQ10_09310, partial [Calditrichaeota bacterium]